MSAEFILYSYFRSSASHRVRIALHYKGIPFEYRAVHLLNNGGEQNSEHYRKLNPIGQVPTLIHKSHALSQSVAIIDYLEQVAPRPALYPTDAYERARVLQVCENVNSSIQPLHNLLVTQELERRFQATQKQRDEWNGFWINRGLEALEHILARTAGLYSFGNEITAADCFVVPQLMSAQRFGVDYTQYETLARVYDACMKVDAFKKAAPQAQPDAPQS